MTNGVSSQGGFRYQDWCAIHFLLSHYLEDDQSLEHLICENDKLDFEIWLESRFEGYQAKSRKNFSAKELNDLLRFSLQYIQNVSRDCFVYIIFQNEPIKSFRLLVFRLSGDRSIRVVSKAAENYFLVALKEIVSLDKLKIDYKILSRDDIRRSVFGLAKEILERKYFEGHDLPTGMIDNFIIRLKDKIEEMSSCMNFEDRRLDKKGLENIIHKIISSQGFSKRGRYGKTEFVRIEVPVNEFLEINIKKTPLLRKPSIFPPENHE